MKEDADIADYDQVVFIVERQWIDNGFTNRAEELLARLIKDRRTIESFAGKMDLVFVGWDADPRELPEIPEVSTWFRKLTDIFPYWFVFLNRTTPSIPLAINLLLDHQSKIKDVIGEVGYMYEHDTIDNVIKRLRSAQAALCHYYNIDNSINEQWSREINDCIIAFSG